MQFVFVFDFLRTRNTAPPPTSAPFPVLKHPSYSTPLYTLATQLLQLIHTHKHIPSTMMYNSASEENLVPALNLDHDGTTISEVRPVLCTQK